MARKATKKKTTGSKRRLLVVLFNLKRGQSEAAYERWARTKDVPTARRLKSIDDFKVFRVDGLFGSDAKTPYRYAEVLEINNIDRLGPDVMASKPMKAIIAKFQAFADNPMFLIMSRFAG